MTFRWTQGSWRGVTVITHLLEWSTAGQCLHGWTWLSPLSAPPEIFTEAQQYVFTQMETTLLSRFLQSQDGQNYLKALVTRDIDRRQKNGSASTSFHGLEPSPFYSRFYLIAFRFFSKTMRQNPEQKAMNSQALLSSSYYSTQTELKMGRGGATVNLAPQALLKIGYLKHRHFGPECFCIYLCIIEPPEMQKPLYFIKRTGFSVPLVPGLYKICWIMRTFACLTHKVLHHCWTIQKLDIIIALVHTVLTLASGQPFLPCNSIQQGRAWERAFKCSTAQVHVATVCWKYTRSLWNMDASIFWTCSGDLYSVRIRGAPL